jgi:mannose-6-phosphate isomerase-like protein (cupin superfamily)
MQSLERIARALGSSQVELMAGAADQELPEGLSSRVSVVLAHEGVQGPFGGGRARILAHGDVPFIPMDFSGENADFGEFYTHDEGEFLHVVSGTVEVDLADEGIHTLEPGDSLHCTGGTLHRWRSADGRAYRMFIVKERRVGG